MPKTDPADAPAEDAAATPPKADAKREAKRAAAAKKADKLRLTNAAVTVAYCADTREAGCASKAAMKDGWKRLRGESKRLSRDGTRVAAVKTACVDVCKFGPVAGVFGGAHAAGGAWYGGCDAAGVDRVLARHAGDGPDPTDLRLDRPPA